MYISNCILNIFCYIDDIHNVCLLLTSSNYIFQEAIQLVLLKGKKVMIS